jgi:hypothetical protein
MLDKNHSNDQNSIAICIADPMAFLTSRMNTKRYDISECVVIGTLISKLPFWAVNHKCKMFKNYHELNKEYRDIIHYKEDLTTGYALGKRIIGNNGKCNGIPVDFQEEITECENRNLTDNNCVAITADVVSLVKGIHREHNPIQINYKFSTFNYLSTGIITTKTITSDPKYHQILCDIIEGIQKAILVVYSSEKISREISNNIATIINQKENQKEKLKRKEEIFPKDVKYILDLIQEERFYPADLNISKDTWDNTLIELSKSINIQKDIPIEKTSETFVDNTFILTSEKSLALQLGIDLDTFKDDVDKKLSPIIEEKNKLASDFQKINKTLFKLGVFLTNIGRHYYRIFLNILFCIFILGFCISAIYYLYTSFNNSKIEEINSTLITSILGSMILGLFKLISLKRKKNAIK